MAQYRIRLQPPTGFGYDVFISADLAHQAEAIARRQNPGTRICLRSPGREYGRAPPYDSLTHPFRSPFDAD